MTRALQGRGADVRVRTSGPDDTVYLPSGQGSFACDPTGHLLYGANWPGCLWRIKLQPDQ